MSRNKKIKSLSLFSGAGIGELRLSEVGIEVVCANELIKSRADIFNFLYPKTEMIVGNISNKEIKEKIISIAKKERPKLLIATPPCQGLSTAGKNKNQLKMSADKRNYLIFDIFHFLDNLDFDFVLIENVPRFLSILYPHRNKKLSVFEILKNKYSKKYFIEVKILNVKDYGVPQNRKRAIIKMYKHGLSWPWPKEERVITLKEAIGHLPSLESGQSSKIDWHYAKKHNDRDVVAMKHTKTGKSAMENKVYYPKTINGKKVKGFHNTFKRLHWDKPAFAITTNCGSIGSHNNVHPGRKKADGTYSDARVLTPLELFIVSSLPKKTNFPKNISDSLMRTVIGEGVPPLFMKRILGEINKK